MMTMSSPPQFKMAHCSIPQPSQEYCGTEDSVTVLDMQIDSLGIDLAGRKSDLERWKKASEQTKMENYHLYKDLTHLDQENKILRRVEKVSPYVAIPSFVIGVLSFHLSPIIALAGVGLTIGTMVATTYSRQRISKISDEVIPMIEEYKKSNAHLESLVKNRTRLAGEVASLDNQYNSLLEKRKRASKEFSAMVGNLTGGTEEKSSVQNDDICISVDGVKLKKRRYEIMPEPAEQ